jgi:ABC-type multidrug transport system fused ATPase/permease subunit
MNGHKAQQSSITLLNLVRQYKWQTSFALVLVTIESLLEILYPLLIGLAVNGLLDGSYLGVIQLAALGACSLLIGTARRFYDTRLYAKMYLRVAPTVVQQEFERGSSVSKVSARAGLLTEFVEFLENSLPEVIAVAISLVGALSLIATLNSHVFVACLLLLALVVLTYAITGSFNYHLNRGYNDQLEQQVIVLEQGEHAKINDHFKQLMHWNIKLSDLETVNYFVIWIGAIALFVYTPVTVVNSGVTNYGQIISILLYVFELIDKAVTFPLFIQQVIRLREITQRITRNNHK